MGQRDGDGNLVPAINVSLAFRKFVPIGGNPDVVRSLRFGGPLKPRQ